MYESRCQHWIDENVNLEQKISRYEKALFALLNLSYASDQDILSDIIVDTLGGFELMKQYEANAEQGEKEFLEHYFKE